MNGLIAKLLHGTVYPKQDWLDIDDIDPSIGMRNASEHAVPQGKSWHISAIITGCPECS